MNENCLECDSYYLDDTVEHMNTSRDIGINIKYTNSDCETAVNVNEENSKIQEKQIHRIIAGSALIFVLWLEM